MTKPASFQRNVKTNALLLNRIYGIRHLLNEKAIY